MEIYFGAIQVFMIPQVIAGLIGGLLGVACLFKSNKEQYGIELTIIFSVLGVLSAGGFAEYMLTNHSLISVILHTVLGAVAGMVGASGVDAVRLAAPRLTRDIVNGTGEGLVQKVISFINIRKD